MAGRVPASLRGIGQAGVSGGGVWGLGALAGRGEQAARAVKTRCRRRGNSGPGRWTSGGLHLANVVIAPVLQTREWAEHGVPRPVHSVFTLYSVPGLALDALPDLALPLAPHHPEIGRSVTVPFYS